MDSTGIRTIAPADGLWRALHDPSRVDGPARILCGEDCLVEGVTLSLDDYGSEVLYRDRFRAYRKGGAAVVGTEGHFPFGAEVRVRRDLRYAANHVRGTTDVVWPRGASVQRCLGLAGVFLPGVWKRFLCLGPADETAPGPAATWHELPSPAAPATVRQWRRPPLALVFERGDGARVEIGTGVDVWRWERCLGKGAGQGRYSVAVEPAGVRVLRAPLAPAAAVEPEARTYRFGWYLAWQPAGWPPAGDPVPEPVPIPFSERGEALVRAAAGGRPFPSLLLDAGDLHCPEPGRRVPAAAALRAGARGPDPCWQSPVAQKAFRRVIRQIASLAREGALTVRGLSPGLCWDPGHCDRQGGALPHWDLEALLSLAEWTRHQLGAGWEVRLETPASWAVFPSVLGLFAQTGFSGTGHESADE